MQFALFTQFILYTFLKKSLQNTLLMEIIYCTDRLNKQLCRLTVCFVEVLFIFLNNNIALGFTSTH